MRTKYGDRFLHKRQITIAERIGLECDAESVPAKATSRALDQFERHFRTTLPSQLRALLQEVNGGLPALRKLKVGRKTVAGVNAFFFLGKPHKRVAVNDDWDYENLWDETVIAQRDSGMNLIPFANDGTGGLFALVQDEDFAIDWIDSTAYTSRSRLANSFDDFVSKLRK